jgi:hypothetical protein
MDFGHQARTTTNVELRRTLSADVVLARSSKHRLVEGHAVVRLDLVVRVVQWIQQHLRAGCVSACTAVVSSDMALVHPQAPGIAQARCIAVRDTTPRLWARHNSTALARQGNRDSGRQIFCQ